MDLINLQDLVPNPNNPRTITKRRLDTLKKSIASFTDMLRYRPIVVDENNVILAGNMRYQALLLLGFKDVPSDWVMKAENLTDLQKHEFVVKDNIQVGDWDWDVLANDFDEESLKDWGLQLDFRPLSDEEAAAMFADTYESELEEQKAKGQKSSLQSDEEQEAYFVAVPFRDKQESQEAKRIIEALKDNDADIGNMILTYLQTIKL